VIASDSKNDSLKTIDVLPSAGSNSWAHDSTTQFVVDSEEEESSETMELRHKHAGVLGSSSKIALPAVSVVRVVLQLVAGMAETQRLCVDETRVSDHTVDPSNVSAGPKHARIEAFSVSPSFVLLHSLARLLSTLNGILGHRDALPMLEHECIVDATLATLDLLHETVHKFVDGQLCATATWIAWLAGSPQLQSICKGLRECLWTLAALPLLAQQGSSLNTLTTPVDLDDAWERVTSCVSSSTPTAPFDAHASIWNIAARARAVVLGAFSLLYWSFEEQVQLVQGACV
jgi:hypothetical protein